MAHLTEHKLQRILTRFPWRRRRPRTARGSAPAIGLTTREGQRLWADPSELAQFEDPGPALVCVAMHADEQGHDLVRRLVEHHARARGIALPSNGPKMTRAGVELLELLMRDAGLDPQEAVGPHPLGELLTATWAIAAGDARFASEPATR